LIVKLWMIENFQLAYIWWSQMGFNRHPRRPDHWMAIETFFGRHKIGNWKFSIVDNWILKEACNMFLEKSWYVFFSAIKGDKKFNSQWQKIIITSSLQLNLSVALHMATKNSFGHNSKRSNHWMVTFFSNQRIGN
jgi:hypothetical protein